MRKLRENYEQAKKELEAAISSIEKKYKLTFGVRIIYYTPNSENPIWDRRYVVWNGENFVDVPK